MTPESRGTPSDWILKTTGLCSSTTNPNSTWKAYAALEAFPSLEDVWSGTEVQSLAKPHFYRNEIDSAVHDLQGSHIHCIGEVREYLPSPRKTSDSILMVLLTVKFRIFLQKRKLRRLEILPFVLPIHWAARTQPKSGREEENKTKAVRLASPITISPFAY